MEINLQLWILGNTNFLYVERQMVYGFQTTERNQDITYQLHAFFVMEGWQKIATNQNGCIIYPAVVK